MTDIFVKQLDGCTYVSGGNNCSCACEAMWLSRATQGRIRTTACAVRRLTGDTSGGTNLEQMDAVSRHFGVTKGVLWRPGSFASLRSLLQTGRYGAIVQVGYSAIAGTDYDCFDGGFRGGHALYVKGGNVTYASVGDPGADGRRGSVPDGWQSYPWTLLQRAAGVLPLGNGMTINQEFGTGHVYAYLTPADPVPSTSRWSVRIKVPLGTPAVQLYSRPFVKTDHRVRTATYNCLRSKVSGYWWFQIEGGGANGGLWFTPNRYTTAVAL